MNAAPAIPARDRRPSPPPSAPACGAAAPVPAPDRVTLSGNSPARAPDAVSRAVAPRAAPRVPGTLEEQATRQSEQESDVLRAREIEARMAADRRLSEARIAAIRADVQTELLRIWEEVLLRRQKVMADLFDKWSKVFFG